MSKVTIKEVNRESSEAFIKRLADSDDYLEKYNYEGYVTEIEYESYDI
tara:strand:- start:1041 stop:1184 length:144 start_codon:yes stop_codon:yes gene_type:complete